jgi:predicted negative regulator of RcsB-dependent stress response
MTDWPIWLILFGVLALGGFFGWQHDREIEEEYRDD